MTTNIRQHKRFTLEQPKQQQRYIAFQRFKQFDIEEPLNGETATYLFDEDRPKTFDPTLSMEIEKRLKEIKYDPDVDIVLVAGNIIAVALMCSVIGCDYGSFRAYAFDKSSQAYKELEMG